MTDKAMEEFEAWYQKRSKDFGVESQYGYTCMVNSWNGAWQLQQAEIERLKALFQDANDKQLDYQVRLGKANDRVEELEEAALEAKTLVNEIALERAHRVSRILQQALQGEGK